MEDHHPVTGHPTDNPGTFSRRQFLGLVAAAAAAEAAGCRRAISEPIVPYVKRPPDVRPDAATLYATSTVLDGYATGLLVQCRDGRPIKVEGNPDHPASLGAAGPIEQASVLQLYDPDRARHLALRGRAASWTGLLRLFADVRAAGGDGLRVLMPPTSSPLIAELMAQVVRACPQVRFAFYAPVATANRQAGAALICGRPLEQVHDFSTADVVVSLDADFLAQGPFWLRYANQWARRRDPHAGHLSRLYCAETVLSVTGSMAEHRLPVPPGQVARLALQLGAQLSVLLGQALPQPVVGALQGWHTQDPWIQAAARDLAAAKGRSVLLAGDRQPAEVHALLQVLNNALENQGKTVTAIAPALVHPPDALDLSQLAAEMREGKVRTLVVLEGNPSYDSPAEVDFSRLARGVPTTIYLGPYQNETSEDVHWFVPAAHPFESWGDARAFDGTLSLLQPLIATMNDERTPAELLAALAQPNPAGPRQLLRASWRAHSPAGGNEADVAVAWQRALKDGFVAGSAAKAVDAPIDGDAAASAIGRLQPRDGGIELNLLADPAVHDGRFTNNGWLLEFPRPMTSLCWGNAALVSPAMAKGLGVKNEDVVELSLSGRAVQAPVFIMVGHADRAVSLHLGFGREGAEHLARHVGVNAYVLRPGFAHFAPNLNVRPTHQQRPLALRQLEHDMHGRDIAIQGSLDWYAKNLEHFAELRGPQPTLMPPVAKTGDQWAMSIDLGQCIGCGACVVACQAENNVPVVGAREVRRGRAMHWLRVDSYIEDVSGHAPRVVHQPMACQHCEDAPCEYVCPVNATVHSADGLNEMIYNRCVGTRFCSNNCPYKVRRFNWFNWYKEVDANQGLVRLQRNPEVTVRDRGVMEKCTYCVQRIRNAQISAQVEDRGLRPGEVVTACQQACPTGAIAFGSLADRQLPVVKRREQPRAYEVLHHQGTRPRTWYLARIDNPNPKLEPR